MLLNVFDQNNMYTDYTLYELSTVANRKKKTKKDAVGSRLPGAIHTWSGDGDSPDLFFF